VVELTLKPLREGGYHLADAGGTRSEHTLYHLLEALEETAIGGKDPQIVW